MRFMENKKFATRIGVVTTVITLAGMLLLWLVVSSNVASVVKKDITNQRKKVPRSPRNCPCRPGH